MKAWETDSLENNLPLSHYPVQDFARLDKSPIRVYKRKRIFTDSAVKAGKSA
jgi:hypothetical protein